MSLSSDAHLVPLECPALMVIGVLAGGAAAGAAIATEKAAYLLPVMALLLVLRWPVQVALGAYAFLAPFEQIPVIGKAGSGISPTYLAGLLTLATLLAVGLMKKRFQPPPKSALWWTLFVVWGAISLAWAIDPDLSMARLRTALSLLVLYLLATSFRVTEHEFDAVRLFTIFGGAAAAALVLLQTYAGGHLTGTHRGTLIFNGTEADPNYLSASLMVPFALTLGECIESRGMRRALMVIIAVTFVLGIAVTGSRGGMLGVLACVSVFMFRMKIDRRLIVVVLCAALLLGFLPSAFLARIVKSDDGGAHRLDIWSVGIKAVPHYLIQGSGWDSFWLVFTDYFGGMDALAMGIGRGPHNLWLGLTVEVGFLGVLFLFLAMRSQLRNLRSPKLIPFEAGCWGSLMTAMFLDPVWRNAFWLSWILLALARQVQQRAESTEAIA